VILRCIRFELMDTAEINRREDFRTSQGDYLPSDIWPGLMHEPVRYELTTTGEEAKGFPELSKSVIEGAMERLSSRQQEEP
jgi:autophagy-related protein 17